MTAEQQREEAKVHYGAAVAAVRQRPEYLAFLLSVYAELDYAGLPGDDEDAFQVLWGLREGWDRSPVDGIDPRSSGNLESDLAHTDTARVTLR